MKKRQVNAVTAALCAMGLVAFASHAQTQSSSKSKNTNKPAATKVEASPAPIVQVVKPPIAYAYIDAATSSSDMPGMNMMGAAMQGGQEGGGIFGALKGMVKGSVTPNASMLGNDIANCFVSAKEAYKVVWQAGGKARFIYLPPGYNNDPCMLRHTAGCSFYQGQCITNDLWIQNLRSTGI